VLVGGGSCRRMGVEGRGWAGGVVTLLVRGEFRRSLQSDCASHCSLRSRSGRIVDRARFAGGGSGHTGVWCCMCIDDDDGSMLLHVY
jgi:hypothetical protein